MKRLSLFILIVLSSCLFSTCLEQIDLEQIDTENLLVVDAMITDKPVRQLIKLSQTVPLSSEADSNPVTDANVWLQGDDNTIIGFPEVSPGNYQTSFPFAAKPGVNYKLHIVTLTGSQYESASVSMLPTPSMDSVYVEYEPSSSPGNSFGGFFNFYLDTKSGSNNNKYYRWTWNSTYELSVPNPSRWLWTGGNTFIIRELGSVNDSLQVEVCWDTFSSQEILVRSLLDGEDRITRQPLFKFHSDSGYMKIRYSIEVKQYAISRESYRFWNLIRESTGQGFLFDTQVGTIQGNISNVENAKETVLGFFEVVQEQSVRKFYTPGNFIKQGYREFSRFIVSCDDEKPAITNISEIGQFMEAHKFDYTLCYFITSPPSAAFCRIKCADCTRYGNSNKRPDFW